jgi:hypothetical protein
MAGGCSTDDASLQLIMGTPFDRAVEKRHLIREERKCRSVSLSAIIVIPVK